MEFSRQEYWSEWPFPTPGALLTQGLNPCLLRLLPWQVISRAALRHSTWANCSHSVTEALGKQTQRGKAIGLNSHSPEESSVTHKTTNRNNNCYHLLSVYYVTSTMTSWARSYYPHFSDEKTTVQTQQYSCPRAFAPALPSTWKALPHSNHKIKRCSLHGRKTMTKLDRILKSRDITLPTKVHSQSYGFPNSHVWMWELDYKKCWVPTSWCFWTVVGEDSWESLGLQGDPTNPS